MEQKKLLWVIFSTVGFVLIVAVVGSILLFSNGNNGLLARGEEREETRESGVVRDFDPIEWVQTEEEHPGIMEPDGSLEPEGTDLVIGESGTASIEPESGTSESGEDSDAAAVDKILGTKDIEIEIYTPPTASTETRTEPVESTRTVRDSSPQPRSVTAKEYWIQTGSYTSMYRADEVKSKLAEKGVASVITTKDVDGSTYYRVRIGPYGAEQEADKFLEWIRSVSGFESSYVSMVYVKKRIN